MGLRRGPKPGGEARRGGSVVGGQEENIRSSASHLAKETRTLRDGRGGSSGRSVGSGGGGRSVGGSRAGLLLVGRSRGPASRNRRAGGGTTRLARHFV